MNQQSTNDVFDLAIIGGGPAGITATIYALRACLKVVLIEPGRLGGQILFTDLVENYPGFAGISGKELMSHFQQQLQKYNPLIISSRVQSITTAGNTRIIDCGQTRYAARAVLLASGAAPRSLGAQGEATLLGKGVSYCATCDGPLYTGLTVAVIGGGDTAVKEALYLSRLAKKVYLIHRRDQLRAEKLNQDKLRATPNVQLLLSTTLTSIDGDGQVSGITIEDSKTGMLSSFAVEGVFIYVGSNARTDYVTCDKDEHGFVKVNNNLETNVPGLFAAGDCRVTAQRQVATAVGDGAMAIAGIQKYLDH